MNLKNVVTGAIAVTLLTVLGGTVAMATPMCTNGATLHTLVTTNGGVCDIGSLYQVQWSNGAYSNASVSDSTVLVSWDIPTLTNLNVFFTANNAAVANVPADSFGDTLNPGVPAAPNGSKKLSVASINFFYTVTPLDVRYGIIQETIMEQNVRAHDLSSTHAVANPSDFFGQKYVRNIQDVELGLAVSDQLANTNDFEDLTGTDTFVGQIGGQIVQENITLENRNQRFAAGSAGVFGSVATIGGGAALPGVIGNEFVLTNLQVPEPLSTALVGLGLLGIGFLSRRKRRA